MAYEKVARDEAGRLGVVRGILRKKHGRLEANHYASRGKRGVLPCRTSARIATVFLWRTFFLVCLDGEEALQLSVEKDMNGEHPTGFW